MNRPWQASTPHSPHNGPPPGRAGASHAADDVFTRWYETLEPSVREAAAREVKTFLERQKQRGSAHTVVTGPAARPIEDTCTDAVLAFARYYLAQEASDTSQSPSPNRRGNGPGSPPTHPQPPPTPPRSSPVTTDEHKRRETHQEWVRRIPRLNHQRSAPLLDLLVDKELQGDDGVLLLQAILTIYFKYEWSGNADMLLQTAHHLGQRLCALILTQDPPSQEPLMILSCELLNSQPFFAEHYECRRIAARSGYDRQTCEPPRGGRSSNDSVMPESFYIVRRSDNEVVQPAQVRWA